MTEFTLTGTETFVPEGTTVLYVQNYKLTSLPPLPLSLKYLYCSDNQLTSLPPLPLSLKYLYCESNQLTSLPPVPDSLTELLCSDNQLTSLPPLPNSLKELYCYHNQLASLPSLPPSLEELYCYGNLNTEEDMNLLSEIRTKIIYRKVLYKLRQRNTMRRAHLFVLLSQINSRPEKVIAEWDQGGIFYQESLLEFEKFV